MRLITFTTAEGKQSAGVWRENGVVDLGARMDGATVKQIIASGMIGEAERGAEQVAADWPHDAVRLSLPLCDPAKIFCVGVNYMNRNAEYGDATEPPKYPSLFMRTPVSLVPHRQPVLIPRESEQLDYEGEIVVVIGRAGRRIPEDRAAEHIGGLTIMNEGSVRDWLRHGKFNVTQGKNFDASGSLGPWIETDVAGFDLTDMRVITRVNGEKRQDDSTASMAFPIARIIAYISTFCTLLPGDMIATGTPVGAGARFDPPRWLRAGDVVEVEVPGIGILNNPVALEEAA